MNKAKLHVIFLVSLLSVACASQKPLTDEDVVNRRAQDRLNALIAKDFAKAYSYASPGFRSRSDITTYKKMFAGARSWKQGHVKSVTCNEDSCDVVTEVAVKLVKPKVETEILRREKWIKIGQEWWIYHK